jgi:hypothetical protein
LQIDLVAHQVTCRGVKGSTSLGMLQALVRHVRGVKWLNEELPAWLAKGRAVPVVEPNLRTHAGAASPKLGRGNVG